ncbi:glycoside hydrolase family 28 protein [Sphingobacterium cavernae]|uniref:glycoside hydrolase family 28 protein n=1 Tax=Sphingobacterium cavernae TaxID=2592657 RepID=UPI0012301C8B|nr:glycoside hydrolase family 28 protein [Sphingobacterium cavernae]
MKLYYLNLLLISLLFSNITFAQHTVNLLDLGAKNDSTGINTDIIRKAIQQASDKGGGTVYFPAGKYITGPIHMKSNITLFIDAGAELHFSDNFDHYLPMVESRWEGTEVTNFSPLIYGTDLENIAIIGRGKIDGHGKNWWKFSEVDVRNGLQNSKWQLEFKRLNKDVLAPDLPGWVERGFLRPPFIQFLRCNNLQIKDITIVNSPFWTINPQYCENVLIDGISINNPPSPNSDGINPESCRNVRIANSFISVGDDCITIKSGKDRSGRKVNIPAENYTITNCTMLRGHGGVVIGSEMSGGVKNIVISNCVFDGTDRGIRLKTARGRGGVVENVRISNIVMRNIRDQAIVLDMRYAKGDVEPVSERTPKFKDIFISNIAGSTNRVARISGLEEMPIENISLSNINMQATSGILVEYARKISLFDIQIDAHNTPTIQASNSEFLDIQKIQNFNTKTEKSFIQLENVSKVNIANNFPSKASNFLELIGNENKQITVHGNNLKNASKVLLGNAQHVVQSNNIQ